MELDELRKQLERYIKLRNKIDCRIKNIRANIFDKEKRDITGDLFLNNTLAVRLFGKRLKDMNKEERKAYFRQRQKAYRAQAALKNKGD